MLKKNQSDCCSCLYILFRRPGGKRKYYVRIHHTFSVILIEGEKRGRGRLGWAGERGGLAVARENVGGMFSVIVVEGARKTGSNRVGGGRGRERELVDARENGGGMRAKGGRDHREKKIDNTGCVQTHRGKFDAVITAVLEVTST